MPVSTSPVNSYDELPYNDHVFPETSPDRLAAMATLYGMSPESPGRARVLELGCANGANLFAMAAAMPEAQFVGIDLSEGQIENGRRILGLLGLKNVTLRAMSLLDVGDDFGRFDSIICHGVYSWIPEAARAKVLAIFARHLAPEGVAYLSYNTYPGWHFRGMVREMLKYHTDAESSPQSQVNQARGLLDFLVRAVPGTEETYGRVLRDEQKMLKEIDDAYVFHEHLEDVNHPVYFHELAASAAAAGLSYLGPARFDVIDDDLPLATQKVLDTLGPDRIRREQYLDFMRNRMFRQSLFCRVERSHLATPSLEAASRLRFSTLASPQSEHPDIRSEAPEEFRSPTDDRLTTTRPLVKAALAALSAARPRSLTLDETWVEVQHLLGPALERSDTAMSLAEVLLKANRHNLTTIHVFEPPIVGQVSDRPVASAVARYQAEAEVKIYNLRQILIPLDDFSRLMIRLLDGTRDRAAIVETLVEWALDGVFEISLGEEPVRDPKPLRAAISARVDESLQELAARALLVG